MFEGHSTVIPVVPAASGMDHAALSRAVQLSVEAKAVRDFLQRTTDIAGDLIDGLINKGGITRLDTLKYLTVGDLTCTHPERSIIASRVIPVMCARLLIQERIPRVSHHSVVSHDMNESLGMWHLCLLLTM